jgi:DNA-binding helix-hairpin-helix protein with protein kinase domain
MEFEGLSTAACRTLRSLFGLLSPWNATREREEAERQAQEIVAAEDNLRRVEEQWKSLCGDAGFASRKKVLEEAKAALEGLKAVEEREWAELAERFRETRLPDHLRTFALEFARIPGLGPAEIARLTGRGIATAADITPERLMAIRRIDLDLVRGLLLFKGVATRAFAFDPVTGIPGKDRRALEERQAKRRAALLSTLQAGPLYLAELRRQTLVWRDVLGRGLAEAHLKLARLRAEAGPR